MAYFPHKKKKSWKTNWKTEIMLCMHGLYLDLTLWHPDFKNPY